MAYKPLEKLRGRVGIWAPGQIKIPDLRNVGYTRVPEETEGINFMTRIHVMPHPHRDVAERIYHIPNGGHRGVREGASFKLQGVRKNIPDYCLPVRRGGYNGLYIELKSADGELRAGQREELIRLDADGYRAVCAWTAEAAFAELVRYVSS